MTDLFTNFSSFSEISLNSEYVINHKILMDLVFK